MEISNAREIIEEIRAGRMVIIVDDEDRENEGDLVMAAEKTTPEAVNFMARNGRGLICLSLTRERARELDLPQMVQNNSDSMRTAFTVSIDLKAGVSTGISAADRAKTIRHAVDPAARPEDFSRPGHIFPLQARDGGVLRRAGHTECAVDLARLAGLHPAGVICEIMKDDGAMARLPDLLQFADIHGLKIGTIAELIKYRRETEQLVERAAAAELPTKFGVFTVYAYVETLTGQHHIAIVKGDVAGNEPVLVRVHSECFTGDILGSLRCDCGDQLAQALRSIDAAGRGVVLYLRQEGRGIGLVEKIRAYALQDQGLDTVEANEALGYAPDLRDYGIGAQILADLGVQRLRLMTNNPRKVAGLRGHGLEIVERVPVHAPIHIHNEHYLRTKQDKLGHHLDFQGGVK